MNFSLWFVLTKRSVQQSSFWRNFVYYSQTTIADPSLDIFVYFFTCVCVFFFFFWVAPHSPALSSSYTPWGWWRGAEPVCDYTWTSSGWWRAAGPAETRLSACTHRRREIQIRAWSKTSRNMKTITFYNREAHHKFAHWYAHQNFFFVFALCCSKCSTLLF